MEPSHSFLVFLQIKILAIQTKGNLLRGIVNSLGVAWFFV